MLQNTIDLFRQAPPGLGLAVGAVFIGLFLVLLRLARPKPIPGIPHNVEAANSFFGDLPEFRTAPDRREWWVSQVIKHQSPMIQVFLRPFSLPWVFVADHWEAVDIMTHRAKEFDRADQTIYTFEGVAPSHHIVMHSSNPQFKRNKELVRDLMSVNFLQDVSSPEIYEKFALLVDLWNNKARLSNGRPFNASEDIHNAALDIVMAASFGVGLEQSQIAKQTRELEGASSPGGRDDVFEFKHVPLDEELRCFTTLTDSILVAVRSPLPRLSHFLYRNLSPTMRRAAAGRDRLRNREIAKSVERRRSGNPERCALDNMLAREDVIAEKEGRKPNYYSQVILDELLGYLVGGHETSSSVIRWACKYLTDDQRAQSLLRKALYEAYPEAAAENRVPTLAEITKNQHVAYLDGVIEESLRHARTASITLRQALVDTQILGVHIPKGTTVGMMASGPGMTTPNTPSLEVDYSKRSANSKAHRKKVPAFDNSNITEFLPERWLRTQKTESGEEETVFDPNGGPAQAFGLGPRGCFGKKLAYIELRIFFTMIFWEFKMNPIKPELRKQDEKVALSRSPKYVYLSLEKTGPRQSV
ncbi:cytochrome P450 [Fusarium solani]|uniref:Cytochrome P450 n=1 Tax=Fusarium solani TaxID=169388 RepID=A0A9P9G9C8_FUSSL|nr:cytochrome P450 [Fusarium solani]KAH7234425.1 cytochrome P450 [Fusarium solani]